MSQNADPQPAGTSQDHAAAPARNHRFKVIVDAHLLLLKDNEILFGLRQNTGYEDGAYHPPAGHMEENESAVAALVREAKEEIGVSINEDDVQFAHVMHNSSGDGRIAFFFAVDRWQGTPVNMEPDKCAELRWFPTTHLPEHMIDYARVAIEHYLNDRPMSMYGW